MFQAIIFALIVVAGTLGELFVSRAMKQTGEIQIRSGKVLRSLLRALGNPWMGLGIAMMAVAFFALLAALSVYNVSFVVPVTALSYVAGAFGGMLLLGEHVSGRRWIGVALVSLGVTLVVLGKS